MKWLHQVGRGCHSRAFHAACKSGHLEVAKWIKAHCLACQEWTLNQPAPKLASFLGELSHFDSSNICSQLDMLQWLLQEYDIADHLYHLIGHAIPAGSQNSLQFLMAQPERYHQAARQSESVVHPSLMELAARHGRSEMLPCLATISGAQSPDQ